MRMREGTTTAMTQARTAPMLLACVTLLSACNTTDALTPQVDIGDSSRRRSSPVTQREVERMAGSEPPRTFAAESRQAGYHPAYNETYRAGTGAPPTTMQEQADALARRGSSPAASTPIEAQALAEPVSNAQAEEEDMGDQAPARQPQQVASIDPHRIVFDPRQHRPLPADHRRSCAGGDAAFPPARRGGALAWPLDQEFERHEQRLYSQGLSFGLRR